MGNTNMKKDINENNKFFIKQFQQSPFEEISYYFESMNEAAIVDPTSPAEVYLDFVKSRNKQLKYILVTHTHSNFPKTHQQIAEKANDAKILIGQNVQNIDKKYEYIYDLDLYDIGQITIEALYTPGHTIDSTCYFLLYQKEYFAVFTGDTLLYSDTGRIDLQQNSKLDFQDMAKLLFSSLSKIKKYPKDILIFPGHDNLNSNNTYKNLQYVQDTNTIFNIPDIQTFQKQLSYQFQQKDSNNSENCLSIWNCIKYKEIGNLINKNDTIFIDTRSTEKFEKQHFIKSINIPIKHKFLQTFLKSKQKQFYVFIVDQQDIERLEKTIIKLQVQNIFGHIKSNINQYSIYCKQTLILQQDKSIQNLIQDNDILLSIIQTKNFEDSFEGSKIQITLNEIIDKFSKQIEETQKIYIMGDNATEKQITASYLEFLGYNSIIINNKQNNLINQFLGYQKYYS